MVSKLLTEMEKTEREGFGGGNTQWEEQKLGRYATSETRSVRQTGNDKPFNFAHSRTNFWSNLASCRVAEPKPTRDDPARYRNLKEMWPEHVTSLPDKGSRTRSMGCAARTTVATQFSSDTKTS